MELQINNLYWMKLLYATHGNMDETGGPPLTCDHQSAGLSAGESTKKKNCTLKYINTLFLFVHFFSIREKLHGSSRNQNENYPVSRQKRYP